MEAQVNLKRYKNAKAISEIVEIVNGYYTAPMDIYRWGERVREKTVHKKTISNIKRKK